MEVIKAIMHNDGDDCEGFGKCHSGERWIARYAAVLRSSLHDGKDINVKLCEHHLAHYLKQAAENRTTANGYFGGDGAYRAAA